ncbi:unnamed protein product [Clonostachys rosea]|uniref:DUF4238 domain-containing protein n=1 Tax=Bionectria ochroleuca TaxID=29856 RepID=A0ABY6UVR8_BIOOC|nr:unnamed protein product [Clonostachys rosea]
MSVKIEYQHFIPQFLIKNFAYPFKCPQAELSGKKKCKCRHEKGKYPNDLVVNCVNLKTTPFSIDVQSVKRVFGSPGMYLDPSQPTTSQQRRIESMFSKLESQASSIFRRIVKSYEAGDGAISLTRLERDDIRKFFFLLKYRGSGFHRRFYHERASDYNENDRERLLEYMSQRGFSTPRDVWYHNIECIINLKMDVEGEWRKQLPRQMFSDDAFWFQTHVDVFYMALCTPNDMENEFILTDNCYNIFEGPNTFMKDKNTGEEHGSYHGSFHEFATISPRLVVVLRSVALLNFWEDSDPKIKKSRQELYETVYGEPFGPGWKSLLHDLPIEKATNSYSQIVGDSIFQLPGHDGKYRPNDKFTFQYYRIGPRHVQILNNLFLENADRSDTLAFKNQVTFLKTLETYISGPCESFKIAGGPDKKIRLGYLQGLETLAKQMGSQKTLLYREMSIPWASDYKLFMEKQLAYRELIDPSSGEINPLKNPRLKFFDIYKKLYEKDSKTEAGLSFQGDVTLAKKMALFHLVIEEDLARTGHLEDLGILGHLEALLEARKSLQSVFQTSNRTTYWLYLKLWRKYRFQDDDGASDMVDLIANDAVRVGPEDVFAKTANMYSEDILKNLMFTSVCQDFTLREDIGERIWLSHSEMAITLPDFLIYHYTLFLTPGSIKHCGIRKIEILAKWKERTVPQSSNFDYLALYPFLDEEERLELAIRIQVRSKFQAAMFGDAEPEALDELERVFFTFTFPTPPAECFSMPSGKIIYAKGRPEAEYY